MKLIRRDKKSNQKFFTILYKYSIEIYQFWFLIFILHNYKNNVINLYIELIPNGGIIVDALSASGLRAIRYSKEIPNLKVIKNSLIYLKTFK